jgi:hypothetical protein
MSSHPTKGRFLNPITGNSAIEIKKQEQEKK